MCKKLGGKFLPFLCKSSVEGLKGYWFNFIPECFNNFPPFFTLQAEQAVTTLSQFVSPPLDLGSKWSKVSSSLLPQYWQENLSLKKTLNLVKLGFAWGTI